MSVTINYAQATRLLQAFGGDLGLYCLREGDGHSGRGLYASHPDYPEDGAIFLGDGSDADEMPERPVLPEEGKSRVVITLTDEQQDSVDVNIRFTPPFKGVAQTGAEKMTVTMLNAIKEEVLDVEVSPCESGEVVHG